MFNEFYKRPEYLALKHDTVERCNKNVSLKITVNIILRHKYIIVWEVCIDTLIIINTEFVFRYN